MKKVQYDLLPSKLEAVGNGSFKYRWAIEEITESNFEGSEKTMFHCHEVVVWGEPTADKVTEAVIAAMWPQSVEAKLINDYNAAQNNVLSQDFAQPYLSFLNERNVLKTEIKDFFNEII